jgi:hypothetical protein
MVSLTSNNLDLEEGIENISPFFVSSDLVSDEDEYNYKQVGKAIIHILVIPILLFYIMGPKAVAGYIGFTMFLYATVFRKKSKEYFSILFAIISLYLLLILS